MAPGGVFAVICAPMVARLMGKFDLRALASIGFLVFGFVAFLRSQFTTDADFYAIALPQFLHGVGIAFFFTPLISINLGGIPPARIANATGLQNFIRMMMGSFGASIAIAAWDNRAAVHHSQLADHANAYSASMREYVDKLMSLGATTEQAYAQVERAISAQAYMLSTNEIFWVIAWLFMLMIPMLWRTRPPFSSGPGAAH
jgi:DHA2 family multidrug resistance protein